MIVDTHAHIYHRRLHGDLDAVVQRARAAGVSRMLMPAIDVPSIHQALALCGRYDGLHAMAGIHPTDTKATSETEWATVVKLCDDPRVVAVGETGLDYYWDRSFDARQQDFLRRHIRLALANDLPLVLHLRDKPKRDECHKDLVRILTEEHVPAMRGVFHCFSGPAWVAEAALSLGFHLGIGGILTFKNAGVDTIVRTVPLNRLVLETDAPFMAPMPHRGRRNEPAYVRLVAAKLAEVKGMSLTEVAEATTANAEALFGIGA